MVPGVCCDLHWVSGVFLLGLLLCCVVACFVILVLGVVVCVCCSCLVLRFVLFSSLAWVYLIVLFMPLESTLVSIYCDLVACLLL